MIFRKYICMKRSRFFMNRNCSVYFMRKDIAKTTFLTKCQRYKKGDIKSVPCRGCLPTTNVTNFLMRKERV